VRNLVIGYGSIGQRHTRLLGELGAAPAVVSRRAVEYRPAFATIAEALAAHRPELVVIATETAAHLAALVALANLGFRGRVLVEKPILADVSPLPANAFSDLRVAYNLRCHPLVTALRRQLAGRPPRLIQAAVGQYLPDWRAGRDWRHGYSADPAQGGGALRDLSHELDLLLWLCGPTRRVAAVGGRSGLLPIASDDHWSILMTFHGGAQASLQLDYLNRPGRRFLAVEHEGGSVIADFMAGTLSVNGTEKHIDAPRDESYRRQLQAMLSGDTALLCDAAGGLGVMDLIAAIERNAGETDGAAP
jgi:predicted dehydrogenase